MSDVKLNEWRLGVVPELHPQAVVAVAGTGPTPLCDWVPTRYSSLILPQCERWYAILSTEPPKMPEPELRLPVGWVEDADYKWYDFWRMSVSTCKGRVGYCTTHVVTRPTRRECVEEINRILEGR